MITWLLCQVITLQAQLDLKTNVIAGPTISNIVHRFEKVPTFFASPRPFFSINYLLGAEIETSISNRLYITSAVFYERISNSNDGFAKASFDKINYLSASVNFAFEPIKNRNYRLDYGFAINYAFNRRFFFFRKTALTLFTGFQLPISNEIAFRSRVNYGISNLGFSNTITRDNREISRRIVPYSFQFTLIYELDLL